jgi:hypothetical protein
MSGSQQTTPSWICAVDRDDAAVTSNSAVTAINKRFIAIAVHAFLAADVIRAPPA